MSKRNRAMRKRHVKTDRALRKTADEYPIKDHLQCLIYWETLAVSACLSSRLHAHPHLILTQVVDAVAFNRGNRRRSSLQDCFFAFADSSVLSSPVFKPSSRGQMLPHLILADKVRAVHPLRPCVHWGLTLLSANPLRVEQLITRGPSRQPPYKDSRPSSKMSSKNRGDDPEDLAMLLKEDPFSCVDRDLGRLNWVFVLSSFITMLACLFFVAGWRVMGTLTEVCCKRKPAAAKPLPLNAPPKPGTSGGKPLTSSPTLSQKNSPSSVPTSTGKNSPPTDLGWVSEAKDWAGQLISGQTSTGRVLVSSHSLRC